MEQVIFKDLGVISYKEAWDYQQALHQSVVDTKVYNRNAADNGQTKKDRIHYLLFCEHKPVYTLGKSGSIDHLLLREERLQAEGFEFFKINRGGDITYHGPGQIVVYPIFDMDGFFTDIGRYIRTLESIVINTLAEFDIPAKQIEGYTGVWLPETDRLPKRKICAIGVHLRRWVTMHGFALNVNTNLGHFNNIVPCGIQEEDKTVTSMAQVLDRLVELETVKEKIKNQFASAFNFEWKLSTASDPNYGVSL